jgi:hypothetical protein
MYPPIFQIATSSTQVVTLLGSNPTRFWPFGQAPQGETRPYAVHQLAYGTPENTLSCPPDTDLLGVQVDVYARSVTEARNVAAALRDAIEATHAIISAWNGESWEKDTGLWRVSMTAEFWNDR